MYRDVVQSRKKKFAFYDAVFSAATSVCVHLNTEIAQGATSAINNFALRNLKRHGGISRQYYTIMLRNYLKLNERSFFIASVLRLIDPVNGFRFTNALSRYSTKRLQVNRK